MADAHGGPAAAVAAATTTAGAAAAAVSSATTAAAIISSATTAVGGTASPGVDADYLDGIVPSLQNVVVTFNVGCKLDLEKIGSSALNAEYHPNRFVGAVMRITEPRSTALVFASGKLVVTGAKSPTDAHLAGRKFLRILQRIGFETKSGVFKATFAIQNLVASCYVNARIRLEGLAYARGMFARFEPQVFPGLIYCLPEPKVTLLIFASGKVVLTGAKKVVDIYNAFEQVYPAIRQYKVPDAAAGVQSTHTTATEGGSGPGGQSATQSTTAPAPGAGAAAAASAGPSSSGIPDNHHLLALANMGGGPSPSEFSMLPPHVPALPPSSRSGSRSAQQIIAAAAAAGRVGSRSAHLPGTRSAQGSGLGPSQYSAGPSLPPPTPTYEPLYDLQPSLPSLPSDVRQGPGRLGAPHLPGR